MHYVDKDRRQIKIFHFTGEPRIDIAHTFRRGDGMISHMKFLKTDDHETNDKYIFYVKDGKNICRFDIEKGVGKLIGRTDEIVLAFYITPNKLR